MRYLFWNIIIMFAAIVVVQCRSVTSISNVRNAEEEQAACMNAHRSARVHRDVKPDFWSLFVDMTGEKSSTPRNELVTESINNFKNLLDTMKKLDINYQNGEITDEHIRIKRAAEGHKEMSFPTSTTEEGMTNKLIDIQRQLVQIQKYLDKLCKEHHATTVRLHGNLNDQSHPQINQVSRITMT